MKKINLLGYLSMALVFIFISCNSEEGILEINKKSFNQQTICGDEMVVDLIAGQHINVGTVTVSNDETNLYVTYNATGDWSITGTHLYIGAEADIPLTKPGNPKFGHFPYHGDSEDPFVIPLANLDDSFVVVAHAVVDRIVNGQSVQDETAFGCGDKEFPGNRWGCYFGYEKQECDEEEECFPSFGKGTIKTCFLDDGFGDWGWTNGPVTQNQRLSLFIDADDCDPDAGTFVGWVSVKYYSTEKRVTAKFWIPSDSPYVLKDTYVHIGTEKYPLDSGGSPTIDPAEFPYNHLDLGGIKTDVTYIFDDIEVGYYIIAHANVALPE